jgi:uncharacterized membrane protein
MSVLAIVGVVVVAVAGYAVYQLVKAKKAVTVGNVVSAVKTDAAAAKADVKKS